jgi:MFS family permease
MSVVPAVTGASERQAALAAPGLAPRDVRYNAVLLGADFALFLAGLAFASQSTILPAFAEHLGAPNVVIGAIPAVMTLGWYLPSLFAAGHTESLARKLPFVLRLTLWERVPFLVLALVAFFLAGPAPGVALAALLVMLLLTTGVGGVLMPAWMDIVGRAIPVTMRGRFFGLSNVIGSAGGLLGSFGTAYFLTQVAPPASFGVCFLCAALCMGLSYVALALVREPLASGAPPPRQPIGAYLRRMPALMRRDHNLRSFLIARALGSIGAMANVFYTVYALRTWGAPDWWVAMFTTVLLAGQMAGNLAFGFLSDRAGHRLVLISGAVAGVAGNLLALGAPSIGVFAAVFALSGIQIASISVSSMNVLLEFAPRPDERPTYVGLGSTLLAPVVFAAPLAAGLLVDVAGFPWVFAAAGVGGTLSAGVLVARVRDPRQHPGGKRDAEP